MSKWNTVTFAAPCWTCKYSKVKKIFLLHTRISWDMGMQIHMYNYTPVISRGGLWKAQGFAFALGCFIFKLLGRKFLPFILGGIVLEAIMLSYVLESFPCIWIFFKLKPTNHAMEKGPLKLTLTCSSQICSFIFFQLYLKTYFFWSGKMFVQYTTKELPWLMM